MPASLAQSFDDRSSILGLLLLLRLGRRLVGRRRLGRSLCSGVGSLAGSVTLSGSIRSRSFGRGSGGFRRSSSLFLLRASSQRQRQRDSGENHFCVHDNDHPDVTDEGGQ